jgi:hypothetical protein
VSARSGHADEMEPQRDTQALLIGHTAHAAVFEPDIFDANYVRAPAFGDQRKPANKEAKQQWEAGNANKIVVPRDDYTTALRVRDNVMAHPLAHDLLTGAGKNELTVVGEYDGELTKARVDRLTKYKGLPCVVDLKTYRQQLTPKNIRDEVTYRHYYAKSAWYLDRLADHAEAERRFIFIFANNCKPWDVAVYELEQEAISQGRRDYRAAFLRWRDGKATGVYPGIAPMMRTTSIGSWCFDGDLYDD